jgi:hypothetical protein
LREYARRNFQIHLEQIDLLDADRDAVRDIGEKLAKLLWDQNALDAWWPDGNVWIVRWNWLEIDNYLKILVECLKNPLVAVGFQSTAGANDWLREKLSKLDNGYFLLYEVAQRLADRWYGSKICDLDNVFCAYHIVQKVGRSELMAGISLLT